MMCVLCSGEMKSGKEKYAEVSAGHGIVWRLQWVVVVVVMAIGMLS